MKKRICLFLALALLLPLILLIYGFSLPSYYSGSYYAELPELYARLEKTEGPRVIIAGGSNVAFGVNSAELEEMLAKYSRHVSVCNFGLYAAVGTSAMLSLSEDLLQEGDLVVLAIEPTSETFSTYFGTMAMLKCAEDAPGLLLHLSKQQRSDVIGSLIPYLQEKTEIRRSGILPEPTGVYARSSFDPRGDLVYERAGNLMALGYDTAVPVDLAALTFEDAFVEQVNAYAAAARSKGAEVVMTFSPMNRSALTDSSEETVYGFYRRLAETFDCQIISDPNSYIMDSGWFYDSNFHLNSAGMTVRTHQLGSDLLTYWGSSARVEFETPEVPASIAPLPEDEIAGADDFLFAPLGEDGLIVTGLSPRGSEKEILRVPAAVDGKPVVSIAADALGSNDCLRELTLPAAIEKIPDGLFAGCSCLTVLRLLHTDRTPDVGEGLLEGVPDLTVYVPREALHLYRDGAGCASNTWERYLDHIVPVSPQ